MTKYSTQQIKELIIQEALRRNIDPALALAVAEHESGFNPNAKNFTNAEKSYGLFQINTKAHPAYKGGFDVKQNIQYGVGVLVDALKKAGGDPYKAFAIYNGGLSGQKASIRNGYPQAVSKLVNKHRNNTVPNSTYIKNKAQGVRMDNIVNGSPLQGQVSNTGISPVSAQGLKNILDSIGANTNITEQKFRETIAPSTKNMLVREMFATGFRPEVIQMYQAAGGDLATLKAELGYGDNPAPWEKGGTTPAPYSAGLQRRQELEQIAQQRAADELALINQIQDPVAKAKKEQGIRDRLNSAFARYNQMADNLQDPRMQNTGYYLDPQQINQAALNNATLSGYFGMPQIQSPQQLAQQQYEAQVANQYGVPYAQVLEAQKNQFDMRQKLLAAQIEQDFALETQFAKNDADVRAAQQRRLDNYYKLQQDALKAQAEYDDKMLQGYLDIEQARVAPTLQGSQNILTKGMDIQGNLMNTDLSNQYGLQKQTLANQADIDKANIGAQTELTKTQMQLSDPYKQFESAGKGVSGFAYGTGFNPQMTQQAINATPFGAMLYPTGVPNLNPNAGRLRQVNQDGGLRLGDIPNPLQ